MPLTSFKWICNDGHVFNNPQPSPESDRVLIATTEEGKRVTFLSMERDIAKPAHGPLADAMRAESAEKAARPVGS